MLSEGEKLLAIMLADVLKAVRADGEIDPNFIISAITGGHEWGLKWKYPGIFHGETTEDNVVEEVGEILTMSRMVEWSMTELTPDELAEIPVDDRQVFVGFDGNGEPHFGVAKFMVEHLGRFDELADREMNSHMPMVPTYRRMVGAYNHVKGGAGSLSLESIKTILMA